MEIYQNLRRYTKYKSGFKRIIKKTNQKISQECDKSTNQLKFSKSTYFKSKNIITKN